MHTHEMMKMTGRKVMRYIDQLNGELNFSCECNAFPALFLHFPFSTTNRISERHSVSMYSTVNHNYKTFQATLFHVDKLLPVHKQYWERERAIIIGFLAKLSNITHWLQTVQLCQVLNRQAIQANRFLL